MQTACHREGRPPPTPSAVRTAQIAAPCAPQVLNTILVPIILQMYFSIGGETSIDQSWYEPGGVVSVALVLIACNMITDLLKLLPPKSFLNKYVL